MKLEELQRRVIEAALGLPDVGALALAGGWAMREHCLTQRPTHDVDLFTPVRAEVVRAARSLCDVLRADGLTVTEVRRGDGFCALQVAAADGSESTLVEIAQDARIWPAISLDLGPVIDIQELAADKMLAMFGRAMARDLVDLLALRGVFAVDQMADFARRKDLGFNEARFNEALAVAASRPAADFEEPEFTPDQIAEVRAATTQLVLTDERPLRGNPS